MKSLLELASRFPPVRVRQIDIIAQDNGKETLLQSFYQLLISGRATSDDEAAALLGVQPEAMKYKKLKSKLKQRLINTAFFVDLNKGSYTDLGQAFVKSCKDYMAAHILNAEGANLTAVQLAKKVLRYAKQYEFTELGLGAARILQLYYATRERDRKQFVRYHQEMTEFIQQFSAEIELEGYYLHLLIDYFDPKKNRTEVHKDAMAAHRQLAPLLENNPTTRMLRQVYSILLIGYMSAGRYREAVTVCDRALQLLADKGINNLRTINHFRYQKLVCHIQLREYAAGREVAEETLATEKDGSYNWYRNRELGLTLALHTRNYQEAYDLFQQALRHRNFRFLGKVEQEKWHIYRAYMHLLIKTGCIQFDKGQEIPRFRVGKFINEVPQFAREKRGMNIPILIAQILHFILQGKRQEVTDRMEAISRYCSRYLKRDQHYRSNCFIRMLLVLPAADYHPKAVARRAAPLVQKLNSIPLEFAQQDHEIEIIPYEDLWEMVMATIQRG